MNYETALALKEAGFPQKGPVGFWRLKDGMVLENGVHASVILNDVEEQIAKPTLTELIEACGEGFEYLNRVQNTEPPYEWVAGTCDSFAREIGAISMYEHGSSPEIAVANLYLSLHGKKDHA